MTSSLRRQRGFLLNPLRFGAPGGGGGGTATVLLHFNGTDGSDTVADTGVHGITISVQGTTGAIQTEVSRFGGASLGALSVRHVEGAHASVAFGTGDFTVQCFAWWDSLVPSQQRGAFQVCTSAAGPETTTGNLAAFVNSFGKWAFYAAGGVVNSSVDVVTGAHQHIEMARASGTLRIFVDGVKVSELADTTNYTGTGFAVGTYYSSSYQISGYVDEFAIHAGAALHTADFTPPTSPFPDA